MTEPDRNIKLIIKVDGKKIEELSIVSLLEQMYYNEWKRLYLVRHGNLELMLKRKSIPTKETNGDLK